MCTILHIFIEYFSQFVVETLTMSKSTVNGNSNSFHFPLTQYAIFYNSLQLECMSAFCQNEWKQRNYKPNKQIWRTNSTCQIHSTKIDFIWYARVCIGFGGSVVVACFAQYMHFQIKKQKRRNIKQLTSVLSIRFCSAVYVNANSNQDQKKQNEEKFMCVKRGR